MNFEPPKPPAVLAEIEPCGVDGSCPALDEVQENALFWYLGALMRYSSRAWALCGGS